MKKRLLSLSLSITTALLSLTILTGAVTAGPSFQQGIADYKAGRYQQALNTFKTFAASYPNNALVHYYLAMSHQAVGHIAQAKQEYQAAILYGDAGLKQQATTGLNQLSKANTQIAYGGAPSSAPSAGGGRVSPGGSSQPKSKVRKIYEFYADWWGPCKTFAPVFDAASRKYSDITFQKLDGDEAQTKTLMSQYGVGGYPTLVFLDGGGQVIYNGGAPRQLEDFENLIGQYR